MMAQISLGDADALFKEKPFITLAEPACGAGCMVLAYADVLNQAGYLSHRHLWVSATDIDPLAAGMAYLQLSLCGVAGEEVTPIRSQTLGPAMPGKYQNRTTGQYKGI